MNGAGFDIRGYLWLLLMATLVAMVGQRVRVPYALALVVTGLVVGIQHLLPHARLDPQTLFTVFLPPILFDSAIQLRVDELRQTWLPIVVLAVAGTVASTLIAGGLAAYALGLPLASALVFGALIAPTDPISVLAVFKRLKVGTHLTLLVEAESLLNDGVALVLFGLLLHASNAHPLSLASVCAGFVTTVAGGGLIGVAIGSLASRVSMEFDDHLLDIMLTTVVAFGSYLCAESLHVSGVIAVVAAGIMVGNYGIPKGMSEGSRLAVTSFWEFAAFAVNSIVFLLIGIEVTAFRWSGRLELMAAAIGAVLLSRAAAVYGLAPLLGRRRHAVPMAWRHVLVWGGLHGALSMAMASSLPPGYPQRETLFVVTAGVVLFSLLGQGLTLPLLLRRLPGLSDA